MADNKFVGFFYVEGDTTNGFIDQSVSYKENLTNTTDKISFMKILGRFKEPVFLSYQLTSEAEQDLADKVIKFVVENTDGERNSIEPQQSQSLWPNFFRIAKFVYDYFYQNISQKTVDTIRQELEEIFVGSRQDSSGITTYSRNVFQAGTLSIMTMTSDPTKINNIKFNTTNVGSSENRQFTLYVNPDAFVSEYIPDDPYIHVYYTDDRDISLNDMSAAISQVQSEIAGKVLNYYRRYDALTVINGVNTTTAFHIWSTQFIPTTDASLLQSNKFREALQNTIMANETALSEEELIIKYPEIFTSQQRVLYCLSENHTINNITVGGSYLLSNPVRLADINTLMATSDVLKPYISDNVEIFTIEANQIWLPIIAAGGLTDKIPLYRPTIAGMNEFQDQAPEEVEYAKVFWRTLVRIINNAYDGTDLNSSISGTIQTGDPTITPPGTNNDYYIFSYKTIEWHVYCGRKA